MVSDLIGSVCSEAQLCDRRLDGLSKIGRNKGCLDLTPVTRLVVSFTFIFENVVSQGSGSSASSVDQYLSHFPNLKTLEIQSLKQSILLEKMDFSWKRAWQDFKSQPIYRSIKESQSKPLVNKIGKEHGQK